MKCLKRDSIQVWYQLPTGNTYVIDEYGNETGEPILKYGKPVPMRVSASSSYGEAQEQVFGRFEEHERVLMSDDMKSPVNVHTLFFLEREPEYDEEDNLINHADYIVKGIAKSPNSISYLVQRLPL